MNKYYYRRLWVMRLLLKKIVIIGTTGSGKTTFLKQLPGPFKGSEVERKASLETKADETFNVVHKGQFENSTTTVGINMKSILFITTKANQFTLYALEKGKLPIPPEDIDLVFPVVVFDTAGQERFRFMQEIGLKGADGVIIFADGSNMSSLEKVADFLQMIKAEEIRKGTEIPTMIFVNKSDLRQKGTYIGKGAVTRWLPESEGNIFETTIYDMETFLLPIREFLYKLDGFPITVEQLAPLIKLA